MNRVDTFLEIAVKQGGSDLHLVSGQPPHVRINGVLHRVRFRELSVEDMGRLLDEFLPQQMRQKFADNVSVDFAYSAEGLGRFRVNAYRHVHGIAAVARVIPTEVPTIDSLDLPPAIKTHVSQPKGLFLVTGPTGSGKSTTLASMIDHINATRRGHIITLEDPIEFIHPFKQCVVTQREIHVHAESLADAIRDAVREDPDVILVGELRDPEAIALALTAAETGIQVLGTLHTNGASKTIDRIINVFPARRQDQVRSMLSESLRMIVSQQLLRTADGSGRVAAAEVLINTNAAKSTIRAGQSHRLETVIQSGRKAGMQSLDSVLKDLVQRRVINPEEAYDHAIDKAHFEQMLPQREPV